LRSEILPFLSFIIPFILSFSSGLVAALNPCVAPMYPLVFSYYLKRGEKISLFRVVQFLAGFLIAFMALAVLILTVGRLGPAQEFIRFAAAGVIALLGVHFLLKGFHIPVRVEQALAKIENPLLFGLVFGLALNPCSLPLFLANAAITAANAFNIFNVLLFGLGVAIPPTLAAVFGGALVRKLTDKVKTAYSYLDKIIGIFMLVAAAFLIWTVGISPASALAASLTILLFFVLLVTPFWKSIFKANKQRDALVTLTVFLLLLWGALTFHCTQVVFTTQFACGAICAPCQTCLTILLAVLIIGYVGFYRLNRADIK